MLKHNRLFIMAILTLLGSSTAGAQTHLPGTAKLIELPVRADGNLVRMALPIDGETLDVALAPASLRAPDFRVRVQRASGVWDEVPAPPSRIYRGRDKGFEVAASVHAGMLTGTLIHPDGRIFYFEPEAEAETRSHLLYAVSDAEAWECASADSVLSVDSETAQGGGSGPSGIIRVAELAFDTDVALFQLLGSSDAVVHYVESVLNAVNAIYETQLGITYVVTEVVVRTTVPGPYASGSLQDTLMDLMIEWDTGEPLIQDATHLITGRYVTFGRGIANGRFCRGTAGGFAVSTYQSNFGMQTTIVAHELAHNWSADHCDPESPDCYLMAPTTSDPDGGEKIFGPAATATILERLQSSDCDQAIGVAANEPDPSGLWWEERTCARETVFPFDCRMSPSGDGVRVYVVSTGIDWWSDEVHHTAHRFYPPTYPYTTPEDEDDNGYGTYIASIVGGSATGVSPLVTLESVQVLGQSGSGTLSGVLEGLDYIYQYGTPGIVLIGFGLNFSSPNLDYAMELLKAEGFVIIVPAGNSNTDACNQSPAQSPDVLTVGCSDRNDERCGGTNYGACVDIFAPGEHISGQSIRSSYVTWTGTSGAAAVAAGIAAQIWNPVLSPDELYQHIIDNAFVGELSNIGPNSPNLLVKQF